MTSDYWRPLGHIHPPPLKPTSRVQPQRPSPYRGFNEPVRACIPCASDHGARFLCPSLTDDEREEIKAEFPGKTIFTGPLGSMVTK